MSQDSSTTPVSTMDKKNFIPASKKLEAGKSRQQDGTGGSIQERGHSRGKIPPNHRHDAQNYNTSSTRLDTSLKNTNPQKGKTMEKKPRTREHSTPPRPNSIDFDSSDEPEVGSLQAPGSRKQNLSHLLQFVLAPREGSSRSYNGHRFRESGRHASGGTSRIKFTKEQFLQSHCQFLVNKSGDYSVYNADPDILVDWKLIEQISVRVDGQQPMCPICLSPPAAAKMTKCGHIYCWACLLHYFALSDKKTRQCPICFDSIEKDDMKSVVVRVCKEVRVGDEIEMVLLCRPKDSFEVEKFGGFPEKDFKTFSKLIGITSVQVNDLVIQRELSELQIQFAEQMDLPEVCFVQEAIIDASLRQGRNLTPSTQNVKVILEDRGTSSGDKSNAGVNATTIDRAKEEMTCFKVTSSVKNEALEGGKVVAKTKTRTESTESCGEESGLTVDKNHYFYQASDGQNAFLHPLNMAMLRKEFGPDPSLWPTALKFVVLEVESESVTEEIRKRYKFISHLPLTSTLQLLELDFKPPFISDTVVSEFSGQIEHRMKRRLDREEAERKLERMQEEAEKKKNNWKPLPMIQSKVDFPKWGYKAAYTEDEELNDLQDALVASLADSGVDIGSNRSNSSLLQETLNRTPFLQIAGKSASTEHDYPSLSQIGPGTSVSASPSPPSLSFAQAASSAHVWKRSPTFPITKPHDRVPLSSKQPKNGEDLDDEYTAPEYRTSVSDAIARAFESLNEEQPKDQEPASSVCQKKKGRKKGKVLFATGVGFGN